MRGTSYCSVLSLFISPSTSFLQLLFNRNNRTKQELIGQRGKIKKSVGLGGWHWLKLHSGEEVRLQRNALTVLEPPSNQESDFSEEEENAANQTGIPLTRSVRGALSETPC